MLGIASHQWLSLLGILLACTLFHFFFVRNTTQLILCSLFTLTGAYLYHQEWQKYHDFYEFVADKKITITGTIIDSNETVINHKKTTVLTLTTTTIATENQTKKCNKLLMLYTKCNKTIIVGDTVTFTDISCKLPSSHDFQQYQIKEQIIATIFDDELNYSIDYRPSWSLRLWIWQHKQRLLHSVKEKFSTDSFRFFSSLFLGNRACIKNELEETNEQFKIWGISHFLARSGLHLVLFLIAWQTVFATIPLPLVLKHIIMLLLSTLYFLLSWSSTPFIRAFALFMLGKICFFNKTPFHLLHYLTLVCFAFLLYCPLYLFFLDFQLTFVLTFALAWFNQLSTKQSLQ